MSKRKASKQIRSYWNGFLGTKCGGFCCVVFDWIFWLVGLPFGCDLEGYTDKETGYSLFTFYATFVAGQQAFLGLLTKAQTNVQTACYLVLALTAATLVGIVLALRVKNASHKQNHAFDKPSIHFGRWVLIVSTVVSLVFIWFAYTGRLPWQVPDRVDYTGPIATQNTFIQNHVPRFTALTDNDANLNRQFMTEWFRWVRDGALIGEKSPATNQDKVLQGIIDSYNWIQNEILNHGAPKQSTKEHTQLLWVEQQKPFNRDYNTVPAEITISPEFKIARSIAFMVSGDYGANYEPVYRQLPIDVNPQKRTEQLRTFKIETPNKNERLVLWLLVESKEVVNDPRNYGAGVKNLSAKPATMSK